MKTVASRTKAKRASIGKLPVVILPLEEYERMAEDLEMLSSRSLPRRIAKAREEIRKADELLRLQLLHSGFD